MDTWVDRCNIDGPAGLKQDRIADVAQFGHEGEAVGLGERFPSCDLHEAASIGVHLRQGLID
jgi:hypothetical protein